MPHLTVIVQNKINVSGDGSTFKAVKQLWHIYCFLLYFSQKPTANHMFDGQRGQCIAILFRDLNDLFAFSKENLNLSRKIFKTFHRLLVMRKQLLVSLKNVLRSPKQKNLEIWKFVVRGMVFKDKIFKCDF
jgi:hypothetical protein